MDEEGQVTKPTGTGQSRRVPLSTNGWDRSYSRVMSRVSVCLGTSKSDPETSVRLSRLYV